MAIVEFYKFLEKGREGFVCFWMERINFFGKGMGFKRVKGVDLDIILFLRSKRM